MRRYLLLIKCIPLLSLLASASSLSAPKPLSESLSAKSRRQWLRQNALVLPFMGGTSLWKPKAAFASSKGAPSTVGMQDTSSPPLDVAYKTITLSISEYGVEVPVACWFPTGGPSAPVPFRMRPKYRHRISVRRIGELLAGWDFIPEFASRTFDFSPTTLSGSLRNGNSLDFQPGSRVIVLSHGFLGSRFDLSHIAEHLASKGFVCVSPEYPESLAASYRRQAGLDRTVVNDALLKFVDSTMKPSAYGVVGHSLGCGTALRIGDASWARVLIAGPPAPEDCPSPLLFISSMNDGLVQARGPIVLPSIYQRLQEGNFPKTIPRRAALIFDRLDAPNHISYLSESVNDAMVSFLSPLLPVAQAMSIPVLDFDKYQISRDSQPTAAIIQPLISDFLVQQMAPTTDKGAEMEKV